MRWNRYQIYLPMPYMAKTKPVLEEAAFLLDRHPVLVYSCPCL